MVPEGGCEKEEEKVCVLDKFECDPVSNVRHTGFFGWKNPVSIFGHRNWYCTDIGAAQPTRSSTACPTLCPIILI
jgi:hypothetical protein